MTTSRGCDPQELRGMGYANDSNLAVRRRTHRLYTLDPVDFGHWTLERLAWRGDEDVLDIGCGPGDLLHEMARHSCRWGCLVGLDLSAGMLLGRVGFVSAGGVSVLLAVGHAQYLPLPEGSFDVVMARHMLYHVLDIDCAVAEAARVLRPGGHFLVTTNSAHNMPEYQALRNQAAARFSAMTRTRLATERFSLESGAAYLQLHFHRTETFSLPGILRFSAAGPFVEYFASSRDMLMRSGHTDAEWQAVLDFVRTEVAAIIARDGHFDVTKVTGAILGYKGA